MTKPRVLHLSADFPDPLEPAKTPVIARLIDLTAGEFDHSVISLNRRSPGPAATVTAALRGRKVITREGLQDFEYGKYLSYQAPSGGLLHRTMLNHLADELADLMQDNDRPDLIIGHKLTVEGIVAKRLAAKLAVPYAITIQGNTDTKIVRFRPDLGRAMREVLTGASHVFCFAPWARDTLAAQLATDLHKAEILPCPTMQDTILPPKARGEGLLSVFHLRNYRGKNLSLLVDAMRELKARQSTIVPLQIVGGGSAQDVAACEKLASDLPQVTFPGARQQPRLSQMMNRSTAFVMPSKRESFGLVFVEALFAGLPIIYPSGTSVDGYFDGLPFAIGVDPNNRSKVADAMAHAIANEADLKAELAKWQKSGGLERFSRQAIADQFAGGLRTALENGAQSAL